METRTLTEAQLALLSEPLPAEAVAPHPTKTYLSTIKAIYVTERLNQVFGVGAWRVRSEVVARENKMVVVKVTFEIPTHGVCYECYGGNDNADLGDAHKGAVTDAITKIGSWLGIGADVFKGLVKPTPAKEAPRASGAPAAPKGEAKKSVTMLDLDDPDKSECLLQWAYSRWGKGGWAEDFDAAALLARCYDCSPTVANRFAALFASYKTARSNGE